jgi:hypothetical protein
MSVIGDPVSIFATFLKIAQDLSVNLKKYLKADYEKTAQHLYLITQNVLGPLNNILMIIYQFKAMNLRDSTKHDLYQLAQKLVLFQPGGDSRTLLSAHCHDIPKIYVKYLDSGLKKFFASDKKKYEESKSLFLHLGSIDDGMENLADTIIASFTKAIKEIESDYGNAEAIRERYVKIVEPDLSKLDSQRGEFDKLASTFYKASRGPISKI